MLNKCIKLFSFLLFIAFDCSVFSNNLQISNVAIIEQDTISQFYKIQFNINWENSWRTDTGAMNWDATWIFVKFRNGRMGQWQHATLSPNSADHTPAIGSTIDAVSDGKGVFTYRNAAGLGNNNFNNILLKWNYGIDGITNGDSVQVKVIGIEMVYVSQGSFYAGGETPFSAEFNQGSNDTDPWHIDSENEINVTNDTGSGNGIGLTNHEYYYTKYFDNIDEDSTGSIFTIPATFPKGFAAFYCMKYEISMGQYAEFLNMLSRQQQNERTETDISADTIVNNYVMTDTTNVVDRNTIHCQQTINSNQAPLYFYTESPERACNYLSWTDIAAILDWSALRPMTELEYEKACRGTSVPVKDDCAWGNKLISSNIYNLLNIDSANEIISNIDTNAGNTLIYFNGANINGPVRCGIFAGSASNNSRQESGASYYGIMEMSGNIKERTISVGNTSGRNYSGLNGDGALSINGTANVLNWPGTESIGTGFRGGSWNDTDSNITISNRINATYSSIGRNNTDGGRGVRTY